MNFKQIETFYWAARLGSFAAAAKRLNATQSAISMRIQEIEARLGVELFDRSQRVAQLTAQGTLLLPLAEEVVLSTERLVSAASHNRGKTIEYIRLGVAETVAITWLPAMLRALRRDHPFVRIELEVALSHVIEEKLYSGALDMALASCEMPNSKFVALPLETVEFVWMCSPEIEQPPDVVTSKVLAELPVIATSREWQFRGSILAWLVANDVHFRDVTICNTLRTAASLAQAGLGYAYLPERYYRGQVKAGLLRRLRCEPKDEPLSIYSIRPVNARSEGYRAVESVATREALSYQG
ncbi:LysR family transcriptional regulator, partial [Mesorhizobium sp. M7D.F.Ca.US.004.03.1.1]